MNMILIGLLVCVSLASAYPAQPQGPLTLGVRAGDATAEETLQPEETRYRHGWGGYYGGHHGHGHGGWGYGGWDRGWGYGGHGGGYGGYGGLYGIGYGAGLGHGGVGLGYGNGGWGGLIFR